jgi:hypothetical protein
MMLKKIINFIRRPEINEQNTGRYAFQQYNGYARAAYNGNGGFTVNRSMNASNPANIAVGPTHKLNDPTVTGNPSSSIRLEKLTQENSILPVGIGPQF